MVLSVPASVLHGADDNSEGRLSEPEVSAHQADLSAQINSGFQLFDAQKASWSEGLPLSTSRGTLAATDMILARAEPDDLDASGSRQVLTLMKLRFPAAPSSLRVETTLF